ncbi:hypothetical protein CRENBAI_026891 [Crenichthys baileyi]|uniref:Uncharacterized protein n=1 Tax=Crenichthys baileyi TaxID=28760 RepID=A0AAV9RC04_9TELE
MSSQWSHKAKSRDIAAEGESNTPRREREREGSISPGVEKMEETLAAVNPPALPPCISSNSILFSMCVCSTAEKGYGNKVISLHRAQRRRQREGENESEKHAQAGKTKENK